MRTALAMTLVVLGLLAGPASAGTLLSDADMDDVSAAGVAPFSPFVAPVVLTVPTTLINIPINVNTIIDTTIGVNTAVGVCGNCLGSAGPSVTAFNPIFDNNNVQIPQFNSFLPFLNFQPSVNVGTPSYFPVYPSFAGTLPRVDVPTVRVPSVSFR